MHGNLKLKYFYNITLLLILTYITSSCSSQSSKPDFRSFVIVKERKDAYINYMLPFINKVQIKVTQQRYQINVIMENFIRWGKLSIKDKRILRSLSRQYNVVFYEKNVIYTLNKLLQRVNVIPTSMVLAQSALESGWGTSNFAVNANNYFGIHCFIKGCGIVPKNRSANSKYEVVIYKTPRFSIQSYFNLLNSNKRYEQFRQKRYQLLENNQKLSGKKLIKTLVHYSELEKGEYERRVLLTMNSNNLYQYN